MDDMLRTSEFALYGVLVTLLIALVANIVILASRPATAKAQAKAKVKTKVGAGGPDQAGSSPAAAKAASGGRSAKAARRPTGLAAYATGFTLVAFVLITAYLVIRISVTGHGPFSNPHEFIVSFVWGILLAYLVTEFTVQLRVLSVGVLPVAFCLALYAVNLDAGVEPLVPALQNNLLLSLHVGFAILAYGAASVSFAAAVLLLLKPRFDKWIRVSPERLDDVGYKAAVVTFPLLTLMIVLGSIWANIAWGRYWSWDPKETAALVTWLVYGAFLHARVVRGWRGRKAAWLLLIGFATIFFAYFGNYLFGGLHSYGAT
ncbi:MAG: c-type cytochrome biogenesis protein CcsB [Micrococcales bacterium]|nr:c-type cytochrome biogenesis protein CcsB [Micrococcales bacterium]